MKRRSGQTQQARVESGPVETPQIRKKSRSAAAATTVVPALPSLVFITDSEPPTINTGSLAYKALTIVLQHWMVPRLGWDIDVVECRLPKLREEIANHRIKLSDVRHKSSEEKDQLKQVTKENLENC